MALDKKLPETVDDLADEALEGFEHLLSARSYAAIHSLLGDLYTCHPVMKRFAEEALAEARVAAPSDAYEGVEPVAETEQADRPKATT